VCLSTLREPLVSTSKVETHFMSEGMKLYTPSVLPRWLNIELLAYTGDELDDFSPPVIYVKVKDLSYLSPFSLWNTKGLRALSFPFLLNTEGHCYDIDSCNQSNTDGFNLDIARLTPSSLASSAMMYYATLSLYHFSHVVEPVRLYFNEIP